LVHLASSRTPAPAVTQRESHTAAHPELQRPPGWPAWLRLESNEEHDESLVLGAHDSRDAAAGIDAHAPDGSGIQQEVTE
jgi:hypothetical protein